MKQVFISFATAIAYILVGLMTVCFMFAFTVQAAEYDIYNNYGQSSDYEVRTDNNEDFTINKNYGGYEVGTFSVPKSNSNSSIDYEIINPGEGRALELHAPSLSDFMK